MPSTTTYSRGQVVVVNVPFTAQTGSKPRPALVVSVEAFHRKLPDVIKRVLGRLHPEDLARVAQGLREAFGL